MLSKKKEITEKGGCLLSMKTFNTFLRTHVQNQPGNVAHSCRTGTGEAETDTDRELGLATQIL